jgi:hypothetical protein
MYLDSVEAETYKDQGQWWTEVTVKVVDRDGDSVSGATVRGFWKKGSGQESCTTGDDGQCSLVSDLLKKKKVTFIVEGIEHGRLSFHPQHKLDNEGNPPGRSAKIKQPKHDRNQPWPGYNLASERATEPVVEPTEPAVIDEPTPEATPDPTEEAPPEPTAPGPTEPSNPEPTEEATPDPTDEPAPEPTEEVTPEPTEELTEPPDLEPTEEATPEPTAEPTEEATVEPNDEPPAEPAPVSIHVADLAGSSAAANGNHWQATVIITVVDENQSPVAEATVAGNWSLDPSIPVTCATDDSGQCSLTSDGVNQNQQDSLTFIVTEISHVTFVYDATGNADPDGDSDGTTITINKPS